MVIKITKPHIHLGRDLIPGTDIEVTRDLGHSLIASGVAEEVKTLLMDTDTFNALMGKIDVGRQKVDDHDEEE